MREEQAYFSAAANANGAWWMDGGAFSAGAIATQDHGVMATLRDPSVELADAAAPAAGESGEVCGFNGALHAQKRVKLRVVVGDAGEAPVGGGAAGAPGASDPGDG